MCPPDKAKTNKSKPTPRNIVKFVAKEGIALSLAQATKRAVARTTEVDVDYIPVKIACLGVGYFAAGLLEPLTDAGVDATFDFAAAKRADRKTKRQAKKEAKKIAKNEQKD
jgi:hypothetical protein